jgi:hypothetical protein
MEDQRYCVDKTYSNKEIPKAISYIEAIHSKGKVAMVWESINSRKDINQ